MQTQTMLNFYGKIGVTENSIQLVLTQRAKVLFAQGGRHPYVFENSF